MKESLAVPSEVARQLMLAGASDEVLIQALAPHVEQGETVERLITAFLKHDHHLPSEVRVRAQVRWYRRAIAAGHLWALYEAGSLWDFAGSQGSLPRFASKTSADEDSVSSEEARQWVIRAAELGHRRACLEAARWNLEDVRAVGWLRVFYGDGVFVQEADRVELAAAALWLARLLDDAGEPEAGDWYRIAAMCPRWADSDLHGATWVEAASEYALWAHEGGNPDLCGAWAFRVLENAADEGPGTRGYMATEWKTYRNDWQLALGEESARVRILWHLLAEHDLPEWQRMEIAVLLTNSWRFGQADVEHVRGALGERAIRSLTLSQLLPSVRAQHTQGLEVPINAKHAWAAVHWLLADAVPAAFRFAGLEDEAADFMRLVPDEIKGVSRWEWVNAAEEFDGWRRLYQSDRGDGTSQPWDYSLAEAASFRRVTNEWISDLTDQAGLGERRSLFQTARPPRREDWVEVDLREVRWRLLRGQQAWLGMCCATASAGEADAWIGWWDDASRLVVFALQGVLRSLCYGSGTDWLTEAAIPTESRKQWKVLGDAYELAFTTFVDQAPALH